MIEYILGLAVRRHLLNQLAAISVSVKKMTGQTRFVKKCFEITFIVDSALLLQVQR
jgi:hypothetical protein